MTNDIRTAVYDLGRAFEQFKDANDQRIREMERRGSADPLTEMKVNRLNAEISGEKARRSAGNRAFPRAVVERRRLERGGGVHDGAQTRAGSGIRRRCLSPVPQRVPQLYPQE
jgi:hypothetical protein